MPSTSTSKIPPGPSGWPLFGSAIAMWKDGPLRLMIDCAENHGELVRLRFGPTIVAYIVSNGADAQHVLQKNAANYRKGRGYNGLRMVLGNGLVTSNDEFWRRQRRLAAPAFHRERLQGFVDTMARCTVQTLDAWSTRTRLDLHDEMTELTLRIVIDTLFGPELGVDPTRFTKHVPVVLEYASRSARIEFLVPEWLPTRARRRFRASLAELDAAVYELIRARRATRTGDRTSMVDMMMDAVDELGEGAMSDLQLRDEVITMIGAGHETTASTLTFVWHLLTHHPDVLTRLQREVDEVLGDGPPTLEAIGRLAYTERVVYETLRLYPSAWNFERHAVGDDVLSGYPVPAGSTVIVCPYTIHRNPRAWPEPECFDPDRFLPERREGQATCDFLPFSAGPRVCIGKQFAMMEAKIVLAMVVQRFQLRSLAPKALPLTTAVTLRPDGGLPCALEPRNERGRGEPPRPPMTH